MEVKSDGKRLAMPVINHLQNTSRNESESERNGLKEEAAKMVCEREGGTKDERTNECQETRRGPRDKR